MIKPAAILVIVTTTHACKLDNVDGAEVHRIPMASASECSAVADALDPRASVRAYCETSKENQDPRPKTQALMVRP